MFVEKEAASVTPSLGLAIIFKIRKMQGASGMSKKSTFSPLATDIPISFKIITTLFT